MEELVWLPAVVETGDMESVGIFPVENWGSGRVEFKRVSGGSDTETEGALLWKALEAVDVSVDLAVAALVLG